MFLDIWAAARRRAGDEEGALHLLDVAHLVDPDPVRADLREAVSNGDLEMLRSLAAEQLSTQPPATLQLLASSFSMLGDDESALDVLRRGVGIHPQDARLHRHLAEALAPIQWTTTSLRELDAFRSALPHAWAAVALQPDSDGNLTLLGRILNSLGESRQAVGFLQAAVDLRPDSTFGRLALGVALAQLEGESERALRELRALRVDAVPGIRLYWSHIYASEALKRQGDLAAAITELESAIELGLRPTGTRTLWIDARLAAGLLEDVERTFARDAPKSSTWYNNLAWSLAHVDPSYLDGPEDVVRLAERGVVYAEQAVHLDDQNSNNWNTLAVARLRARDYAGAREAAEHAIELNWGVGTWADWFTLASCFVELGDPDQGRIWYGRGIAAIFTSGSPRILPEVLRLAEEAAERLGMPGPSTFR
jgi:tetratricopeptide (TPR) repeat protein